jgi:hypothetical protein
MEDPSMDALMILVFVIGGFVAFDVAAWRFGADSREPMRDDHRR